MSCNKESGYWFPPFAGFTEFTPVIPKMYFDVHSVEQRYHVICSQLHKLVCYVDKFGEAMNITRADIEELKEQFQKFIDGGFEEYYEGLLNAWIIEHMPDIIRTYVKQVFFGLTLDGYFVAYIPEGSAWKDVIFDTGQMYELDTYGRLMLYYETDSSSEIWQEQSLSQNLQSIVNRLDRNVNVLNGEVSDLDTRVTANESAINSPITRGDL